MSPRTVIGAVDIGGTKIAVGAVDPAGRLLAREESPTAPREGFDAAVERIHRMLESVAARAGAGLRGIGIGCTGPVDPVSGYIGEVEFLPGWRGRNPVRDLESRLQARVAMENDADAAALGELAFGAGRGRQHLICVTVGTGIGGGIVVDGRLLRGLAGAHPEVGHHVIASDGPPCFCGARGCWEALASGPAMVEWLKREAPRGLGASDELTAAAVCDRARQGDALAGRAVAREAEYLGLGIANLITLYVPEVIVLAGSVMQSDDLLMPGIHEVVARQCRLVPAARVEVRTSPLGADAPLIGAASVWAHRFGEGAP